jgi:DNA-binding transcriptional LysR family regulator
LDRSSQGVELTTHGAALLRCGVTVFNEMRHGLKVLEALSDPTSGELRVGCPEITMAGLLPAIVERFFQQYPRIRLHVAMAQTAMLQFQELRERNIDLLIGRVSQELSGDDLVSEILFDEPFLAVAGMNSKLARRRHVTLEELSGEPWVLPPYDSVPGALILQIFRASKLQPPRPSIATLSGQLTATLIASGRFVGVLPSSVAHFNRQAGLQILPVKLPAVHLAAGIITVKNRTLNPSAKLFIDCAREVARPMAKLPGVQARHQFRAARLPIV